MRRAISILLILCCGLPAQVFQSGGTTSNSYTPQALQTVSQTVTGTGTVNAINVNSESGLLISVDVTITTSVTGAGTTFLEIQVDGGTTTQYSIVTAGSSNAGQAAAPSETVDTNVHAPLCTLTNSAAPTYTCLLGGVVQYKTSLRVGLNTTVGWTTGVIKLTAARSVKA